MLEHISNHQTITPEKFVNAIDEVVVNTLKKYKYTSQQAGEIVAAIANYYCTLDERINGSSDSKQQWDLDCDDNITLIQSLDQDPMIVINGKAYTPDEALELSAKLIKIHNLAVTGNEDQPPVNDLPESFAADEPGSADGASVESTGDIIIATSELKAMIREQANRWARACASGKPMDVRTAEADMHDALLDKLVVLPKADLTDQGWGNVVSLSTDGNTVLMQSPFSSPPLYYCIPKDKVVSFASTLIYLATRK